MPEKLDWTCQLCGSTGFSDGADGFFYCGRCGSQAEDIIDTAVADEDLLEIGNRGAIYSLVNQRARPKMYTVAEPVSQLKSEHQSQIYDSLGALGDNGYAGDGVGPTQPSDFARSDSKTLSYNDYYTEIRMRYVMGVQMMIQLQCQALVEQFHVSPLIVGFISPIWLRFVASTNVLGDDWADEVIHESESRKQGEAEDYQPTANLKNEPRNMHGQRAVVIWYQSLYKKIPLSCTLSITFLLCHVAREAILPTDILKWTLEGKLPYFAAFVQIGKQLGPPTSACPLSANHMFRPTQAISLQKLESVAASIAQTIGLELPPVNFYAIASRYLRQLSLPTETILPQACRVYEWSMPSELWLSSNEYRIPTRVCVMSILIVTIRILYNINGFGKWETSLSTSYQSPTIAPQIVETGPCCDSDINDDADDDSYLHDSEEIGAAHLCDLSDVQQPELDASELLKLLDANYNELGDTYEYSKDLPTYLQYCKDVVFAGLEPSLDDYEEEKMINDLWDFYQSRKVTVEPSGGVGTTSLGSGAYSHRKMSRHDVKDLKNDGKKFKNDVIVEDGSSSYGDKCSQQSLNKGNTQKPKQFHSIDDFSVGSQKDRAIRRLKEDMEENRFCYIPPRAKAKNLNYVYYSRKKEGTYLYAAHADYYILLRSCAKEAQVDARSMHIAVLAFERRLTLLEKNINYWLHARPPNDTCEFCVEEGKKNVS